MLLNRALLLRLAAMALTAVVILSITGSLTGVTVPSGLWKKAALRRVSAPNAAIRSWDRIGDDYLAFCLIIQNQHKDVREWVAHHHAVGGSTIYVHDHRSEPPLKDLLTDYIDAGIVQYTWWNRSWDNWNYTMHQNPQMDVYATCLREYGTRHQFLGFLDSDEYLVLQDKSIPSVPHLLREMMAERTIGGLAVHWRVFGSSGHIQPPKEGVLQAFTKCTPLNWMYNNFVKTLANTDYTVRNAGHIVDLNSTGVSIVKENWTTVVQSECPPTAQTRIAIHHYMIKSRAVGQFADLFDTVRAGRICISAQCLRHRSLYALMQLAISWK